MRIVFATAEVSPVAKTGGLGDVCGSLPKELARLGHDVTVFMPFYRQARQYFDSMGIEPEIVVPTTWISWGNWSAETTLYRTVLPGSEVPLILVASEQYFDRDEIYPTAGPPGDFVQRYVVFCRAVIEGCEALGISPDILHCHDWHTALLPVYLHSGLRSSAAFEATRSVYTIHNLNYQGAAPAWTFPAIGLPSRYWSSDALEHYGEANPMKAGIIFADQVTTVSPNYAREVQTPEHGAGLDGVLRSVAYKFTGILNGIDTVEWNPAADEHLPARYSAENLVEKIQVKKALAREAGLSYNAKRPILGVVSRLVEQKGFQLLLPVLGKLLRAGAQAVILGSGDRSYEEAFVEAAERQPESCRVWIGFDPSLAHRIYAGCDLMLMPSMYEPCGLNQMYALRYGTLPVVRLTGGLADTVIPFDGTNAEVANGFGFSAASSEELYFASWISVLNYRDQELWRVLQRNGMAEDFSWSRSAAAYEDVYARAAAG